MELIKGNLYRIYNFYVKRCYLYRNTNRDSGYYVDNGTAVVMYLEILDGEQFRHGMDLVKVLYFNEILYLNRDSIKFERIQ